MEESVFMFMILLLPSNEENTGKHLDGAFDEYI